MRRRKTNAESEVFRRRRATIITRRNSMNKGNEEKLGHVERKDKKEMKEEKEKLRRLRRVLRRRRRRMCMRRSRRM